MYSAITYNHKAFVKILLNPKLLEYQIITSKLHNVSNFFLQVNVVIIKNYNKKKKIHQDKIKETKIAMFSSVKSGLVNKM